MQSTIKAEILKTLETIEKVLHDSELQEQLIIIAKKCIQALKNDNKLLFAGNGGSAADSQHLAAELVSKLNYDRPGLCAIALTTDTSALTAIGNDYGYEKAFSRQVEAIGKKGDVLIAISTSGNSANILMAINAAKQKQLITVGFTKNESCKMHDLCDFVIKVSSNRTPNIQEAHIMLGHILCGLIEDAMFGETHKPKI